MNVSADQSRNAMKSTVVNDKLFVLERMFDAPRELVFKVFSSAEHLANWWGPKDWTLPVCRIDFRPGGEWHYCMRSPGGDMESWGKAVYEEIVEPERIVYVDYFSDAEGNVAADMPETRVTMTFINEAGKTKLVSSSEYATADALQTVLEMGMMEGIGETWDRLADLLRQLQNQ